MRVSDHVRCNGFPCSDVRHECYTVPSANLAPDAVSIILISEAAAPDPADNYDAPGDPLFARTTVQAFQDAGAPVASVADIRHLGVHLTTAVKCGKTGYAIATQTVKTCSLLLQQELALFPRARVLLLMGDVAIAAVNEIARRSGERRVVPAGSTYKIRGGDFTWRGLRVFPSYLQAGPSFFIEKSKRDDRRGHCRGVSSGKYGSLNRFPEA